MEEGILNQDEETKRFSLKPDDAAIRQTSEEIRELTRLTLEKYAQKARKRELS